MSEVRTKALELAVDMFCALVAQGRPCTKEQTFDTAGEFANFIDEGQVPTAPTIKPTEVKKVKEEPAPAGEFANFIDEGQVPTAPTIKPTKVKKVKEEPAPQVVSETAVRTLEEAREAALKLQETVGKDALKKVLALYKLSKFPDLDPSQYDGFIISCETRLKDHVESKPAEDDLGV